MGEQIIGICDDEIHIAYELEKSIQQYAKNHVITRIYSSGERLLEDAVLFHTVFLDIDMPGMDGIETGRQLLNLNPDCKIIMSTGMAERANDGCKIHAIRYLIKPFCEEDIREAVQFVLKEEMGIAKIKVYSKRRECCFHQYEIHCMTAFDSYVEFLIGDKLYRKDTSLSALEEVLDQRMFVRINRKQIINLKYVKQVTQEKYLFQDKELKIARGRKKDFFRTYQSYDFM